MRILVYAFLLFLPLILYFLWAYIVRRKMEDTGGTWDDTPLTRLFIAGLLLMGAALIVTRFMSEGEDPTSLVPEQYEDNRFLRSEDYRNAPEPPP